MIQRQKGSRKRFLRFLVYRCVSLKLSQAFYGDAVHFAGWLSRIKPEKGKAAAGCVIGFFFHRVTMIYFRNRNYRNETRPKHWVTVPRTRDLNIPLRRVPLAEIYCSIYENFHIVYTDKTGESSVRVTPACGGVEIGGVAALPARTKRPRCRRPRCAVWR